MRGCDWWILGDAIVDSWWNGPLSSCDAIHMMGLGIFELIWPGQWLEKYRLTVKIIYFLFGTGEINKQNTTMLQRWLLHNSQAARERKICQLLHLMRDLSISASFFNDFWQELVTTISTSIIWFISITVNYALVLFQNWRGLLLLV
jgi:hypothetical protein